MMDLLERISDEVYHGFFVDLYVRLSNDKAIDMYERLGYSVYRRVRQYYSGSAGPGNAEDEDAYGTYGFRIGLPQSQLNSFPDMRKPLSRDVDKRSVQPNGRNIYVKASEVP